MRSIVFLFFLGQFFVGNSQALEKELSLGDFVKIVKENHPVYYQAALVEELAEGNLLMAKGEFDPKLGGSIDAKSFDEKNYYNVLSTGVKIPTWIGVDVKGGYDRSSGFFLDDSDNLPNAGLFYAGISVPLGKGLIIDERRAMLQKARIFMQSSAQLQKILKNEILFEAITAYFDWQEAYFNLQVAREGSVLAQTRFVASRSSFRNGDKPAIDTLESFIALQNRNIQVAKAEQNLVKAVYRMNNFIWLEGRVPLELEDNTVPQVILTAFLSGSADSLNLRQDELIANHPEILTYEYKLDELDVERRLAVESLKPDLRIDYNPLYEAGEAFLPRNNYKVGVSAAYPIFLRKERGKLKMNSVKVSDTQYEMDLKSNQITNQLDMYYRLQQQISEQNDLIAATVENYSLLVDSENRLFSIGESSIFLINTREVKFLESRYKLIEGRINLLKTRLLYLLYTGELNSVI